MAKGHKSMGAAIRPKPAPPSPFEAAFDVVIPWVDFSDAGYCAAMGRPAIRSTRGFTEVKYLLRSLQQQGWLEAIRTVIIVHSDFHPPPSFLRQDHPRLRFVSHGAFAPPASLPLRGLEEIAEHVHRIDGLTPWFLFAEDDGLVMSGLDVFRRFVWRRDQLAVYAAHTIVDDAALDAATSWERGAAEACRLLREAYGPRDRCLDLHTPHLLHTATLQALAERWPGETAQGRPALNRIVLHNEHLVDEGLAICWPHTRVRVDRLWYADEIHTNSPQLTPPVTLRKVLSLCLHLNRAERRAMFLNIQGPGISAEYDDRDAKAYGVIADAWLARVLSTPSTFEPAAP